MKTASHRLGGCVVIVHLYHFPCGIAPHLRSVRPSSSLRNTHAATRALVRTLCMAASVTGAPSFRAGSRVSTLIWK